MVADTLRNIDQQFIGLGRGVVSGFADGISEKGKGIRFEGKPSGDEANGRIQ